MLLLNQKPKFTMTFLPSILPMFVIFSTSEYLLVWLLSGFVPSAPLKLRYQRHPWPPACQIQIASSQSGTALSSIWHSRSPAFLNPFLPWAAGIPHPDSSFSTSASLRSLEERGTNTGDRARSLRVTEPLSSALFSLYTYQEETYPGP